MRKGAGGSGGLALLTFSSARSEGSQSLGGPTSPPSQEAALHGAASAIAAKATPSVSFLEHGI